MSPLAAQLLSAFSGLATTLVVTWFQNYLRTRSRQLANGHDRRPELDDDFDLSEDQS